MAISIQQLEYFAACAETGSYREAAETLYRSYQSVYQGVSQLEKELGGKLFAHDGSSLALTDYGEYVITRYVRPVLEAYDRLGGAQEDYTRHRSRSFRIGTDGGDPRQERAAESAAEALRERHPEADIRCDRLPPEALLELLRENRLDMILRLYTPLCEPMRVCMRMKRELGLYVGRGHRLAERERISVDEIREENFLFHNPATYQRMSFWALSGISMERAVLMTPQNSFARQLLDEGKLVRVSPVDGVASLRGLKCLRFDPPMMVEAALLAQPEVAPTALEDEYLGLFKARYERLANG